MKIVKLFIFILLLIFCTLKMVKNEGELQINDDFDLSRFKIVFFESSEEVFSLKDKLTTWHLITVNTDPEIIETTKLTFYLEQRFENPGIIYLKSQNELPEDHPNIPELEDDVYFVSSSRPLRVFLFKEEYEEDPPKFDIENLGEICNKINEMDLADEANKGMYIPMAKYEFDPNEENYEQLKDVRPRNIYLMIFANKEIINKNMNESFIEFDKDHYCDLIELNITESLENYEKIFETILVEIFNEITSFIIPEWEEKYKEENKAKSESKLEKIFKKFEDLITKLKEEDCHDFIDELKQFLDKQFYTQIDESNITIIFSEYLFPSPFKLYEQKEKYTVEELAKKLFIFSNSKVGEYPDDLKLLNESGIILDDINEDLEKLFKEIKKDLLDLSIKNVSDVIKNKSEELENIPYNPEIKLEEKELKKKEKQNEIDKLKINKDSIIYKMNKIIDDFDKHIQKNFEDIKAFKFSKENWNLDQINEQVLGRYEIYLNSFISSNSVVKLLKIYDEEEEVFIIDNIEKYFTFASECNDQIPNLEHIPFNLMKLKIDRVERNFSNLIIL